MAVSRHTLIEPPIETLLDKVDSKFTLVTLAARRARQINDYYTSLGQQHEPIAPPQVTSTSGKTLSIAFEEISAGAVDYYIADPEEEAAEAAAKAAALADEAAFYSLANESSPAPEL
jgi:DNA-directed RNA polymerase subunit omega